MTPARHILPGLLAALLALGIAWFAQDVLRMIPCPLCYIERWPWRIVIALGILGLFCLFGALRGGLAGAIGLAALGFGYAVHPVDGRDPETLFAAAATPRIRRV